MPELPGVVDTLEDVPEALREFYSGEDGEGWRLNASGLVEKGKLAEFRRNNIKLQKALEKYDGIDPDKVREIIEAGVDVDHYTEMLAAEREREDQKAQDRGEWDKLRSQLQDQHVKEKDELSGAITGLESQLHEQLVDNAARKALEKHGAYTDLLLPHVRASVRVVKDDDGRRKAIVVDGDGDRRLNNSGEDMSIEDLVVEMRDHDSYSAGFKPSGKTGGGAAGQSGGGATGKVRSRKDLKNRADKLAFIKQYGDEAFLALPEN